MSESIISKKTNQKFDREKTHQMAAGNSVSQSAPKSETLIRKSAAEIEEEKNLISLHIIWNDYNPSQNSQKIRWLFEVQRLFSIQLPKMPREYVTRLVFDKSHRNLIIHKKDKGIIAGICYRLFQEQGFAEIVFCAVTADEQVKGYGTHMMNHLKDYMVGKLGIFHLLTYADEFAIGYFIKQDFITEFALPPEQYKGYIKEYQGATLMYCQLHPKMIYIKAKQIYHDMRELYTQELRKKFPNFGKEFQGLAILLKQNGGKPLKPEEVPGIETLSIRDELERGAQLEPIQDPQKHFRAILQKLKEDKNSWPFKEPVDPEEVPEYHDYISFPIDLGTMSNKLKEGYYTHERMFIADLKRMFDNCYKFNAPESQYYYHGYKLNEHCAKLCRSNFPHSKLQPTLPEVKPQFVPSNSKK